MTNTTARFGYLLFAISMMALGVLGLASGDFALNWQPVPEWIALRQPLAYLSGLVLLVSGVALLFKPTALRSAQLLTIYLIAWMLLLRVPPVISHPDIEVMWLGLCENLVMVAGGWIVLATLTQSENNFLAGRDRLQFGRLLFAIALPLIGLSHFVYADQTAAFVPAWLPDRLGLAYLTGAGHIAAAAGLLFGILPRLAATLEAAMMSVFGLLVWLPNVIAAPADRFQWTGLVITAALAASAWIVAGTLAHARWGFARPSPEPPLLKMVH